MHKQLIMFLFVFAVCCSQAEAALPEIGGIRPSKLYPGQTTEVLIFGHASADFPNDVQVDLGEGITISSIGSYSPWTFRTIKAPIVISDTASLGYRDLTLSSVAEDEVKVMTNAIEIVGKSSFPVTFDTTSIDVFLIVRRPTAIAMYDFDNDDDLDVAVGGSGVIALFKNSGTGALTFYKYFKTKLGDPSSIVFGDFNGDKNIDFAVSSPLSAEEGKGYISIFYGKKDGTFKSEDKRMQAGYGPTSMSGADFNSDGITDLVVANEGFSPFKRKGNISIYFGMRNRQSFKEKIIKAGNYPESVIVADFNKDGIEDIVYSANKWDSIFTLLGNGKGHFRKKESSGLSLGHSIKEYIYLAKGDFNNDKKQDLAAFMVQSDEDALAFLVGNGNGKFSLSLKDEDYEGYGSISSADFNNDGMMDLLTGFQEAWILLGNGDFSFSGPYKFSGEPFSTAIGDLNGDGYMDVVSGNYQSGYISILINTTTKP